MSRSAQSLLAESFARIQTANKIYTKSRVLRPKGIRRLREEILAAHCALLECERRLAGAPIPNIGG